MTNNQDTSVEWEKEWDRIFGNTRLHNTPFGYGVEQRIKDFIRTLLSQSHQQGYWRACKDKDEAIRLSQEEIDKNVTKAVKEARQQGYKEGYLAGGKAERERTKKLIDNIHEEFKRDVLKLANPALSLAAGIEIKINKYEKETKGDL